MDAVKLTIFSTDKDYSLALSEALSSIMENFIIEVCENEKELSEERYFDLLLLDCNDDETNKKFSGDTKVIRLSESRTGVFKNLDTPEFVLYKYSSAKEFTSDILLYCSMLTGKNNYVRSDIESKVIAFCGGAGGVGKTVTTFGTGQALRRYYAKSVLYISMEEIESTLMYIQDREDGFGLCEYLYYLFKNDNRKPDHEAFMIFNKYGIGAFRPDKGRNMLRELDTDKLNLFFKEVSKGGVYDYILVDMGECFSDEMKWVLSVCHKVVVILTSDIEEDERQRRFRKYLRFSMGAGCEETFISVINKVYNRDGVSETDDTVYIDFDEDSIINTDGIFEISIDQDFGVGIKSLMKRIL